MANHQTRIMYIERKAGDISGTARIGKVTYSKSGRSLEYGGKTFIAIKGFKSNFLDTESNEEYWISGPKRNGQDRLHGHQPVEIDDDVREEYWTKIRMQKSSTPPES
jgi:hypothetical protein